MQLTDLLTAFLPAVGILSSLSIEHVLPEEWIEQWPLPNGRCPQTVSSLENVAKKLGGKLLSAYVTTGQYDVVLALDYVPNGEATAKFASAISGSGNARTTTARGYAPDEFSKLVAEVPKF